MKPFAILSVLGRAQHFRDQLAGMATTELRTATLVPEFDCYEVLRILTLDAKNLNCHPGFDLVNLRRTFLVVIFVTLLCINSDLLSDIIGQFPVMLGNCGIVDQGQDPVKGVWDSHADKDIPAARDV